MATACNISFPSIPDPQTDIDMFEDKTECTSSVKKHETECIDAVSKHEVEKTEDQLVIALSSEDEIFRCNHCNSFAGSYSGVSEHELSCSALAGLHLSGRIQICQIPRQ